MPFHQILDYLPVERVHFANAELHEVGSDDLEEGVQPQAADLVQHVEEYERHDTGPEGEGHGPDQLNSKVVGLARVEKALSGVEKPAGNDAPEAAYAVRLGHVKRVVDLKAVQELLSLLIDETAYESDDCGVSK